MSTVPPGLFFDLVSADEVKIAHDIEAEGFPPDEAASLPTFVARQRDAPDLFLGAFLPIASTTGSLSGTARTLIGYVCATRAAGAELTAETMKAHEPHGRTVCVHAVGTAKPYRRLGVASALLREYVRRLRPGTEPDGAGHPESCERVVLLCHDELRGMYERVGFACAGRSAVVHGARPWLEMRIEFSAAAASGSGVGGVSVSGVDPEVRGAQTKAELGGAPPGILEALQASAASRARPAARLLSTFDGMQDVVVPDADEEGARRNRFDLLCPRPGCSCTILKAGVGRLVEKESVAMDLAEQAPTTLLAPLPAPGQPVRCWLVGPTPMAFENIGFSKPVGAPANGDGRRLKLLSCADCDLGPLGWSEEGGQEFWVLCARVGYRA